MVGMQKVVSGIVQVHVWLLVDVQPGTSNHSIINLLPSVFQAPSLRLDYSNLEDVCKPIPDTNWRNSTN